MTKQVWVWFDGHVDHALPVKAGRGGRPVLNSPGRKLRAVTPEEKARFEASGPKRSPIDWIAERDKTKPLIRPTIPSREEVLRRQGWPDETFK